MEVDRSWTDEQLRGHVPVGQPLPDQGGDLPFLRGQLGGGGHVAAPGGLPGGAQLGRGPLGPRDGTEVLEQRQRGAQMLTGVDPAAGTPEVLAGGQVGAGPGGQPGRVGGGGGRARSASRGESACPASARAKWVSASPSPASSARPCSTTAVAAGEPVPAANCSSSASQVRARSGRPPRPVASNRSRAAIRRRPGPPICSR